MSRLTAVDANALAYDQKLVFDNIVSGPRGRISAPFLALLHSPPLASVMEKVGVYLRYETRFPARLRELSVLVVCSHWRCGYEWGSHAPLAIAEGVSEDVVAAIGAGHEPRFETADDALVFRFSKSLVQNGKVAAEDHEAVVRRFGEAGVVDLTGIIGYYMMLALAINAHAIPETPGVDLPWQSAS